MRFDPYRPPAARIGEGAARRPFFAAVGPRRGQPASPPPSLFSRIAQPAEFAVSPDRGGR
ncbi:MAG: hypothetical protein D6689_03005 [Deltaproteobacteria bacterium]|nr:MAG: hypothetical protein D6689_03005 [Deltaproteobacteria bacterium]